MACFRWSGVLPASSLANSFGSRSGHPFSQSGLQGGRGGAVWGCGILDVDFAEVRQLCLEEVGQVYHLFGEAHRLLVLFVHVVRSVISGGQLIGRRHPNTEEGASPGAV